METTDSQDQIYTVQEGDTIFNILVKFNMSYLNFTKKNPGIKISPGVEVHVEPDNEKITLNPIDSQLFERDPPVTGALVLSQTRILFYPTLETIQNCQIKGKLLEIDLLGLIDSTLKPHPCEFLDDENSVAPDDCLALLQVTYLAIPRDPTSVEMVSFAGMLQELRNYRTLMEQRAAKYQVLCNYTPPLLSTIVPSKNKTKKLSPTQFEGESNILTPEQVIRIRGNFPRYLRSSKWTLLYALDKDGSSFTQFSNKTKKKNNCVLVIKTDKGDIIGAFSPEGFGGDMGFCSSGEAFVYTFYPSYAAYKWSKVVKYLVSVTKDELMICGDNAAAIWLDNGFINGFSEKCTAFNSPPLASSVDYKVVSLEVWYIR